MAKIETTFLFTDSNRLNTGHFNSLLGKHQTKKLMHNRVKLISSSCLFTSAIFISMNSFALAPMIETQPQSATVIEGNAVTFAITLKAPESVVAGATSGNLRLWLKADTGVTIDSSNRVSRWQDFSGLANDCSQMNANKQPLFVANGFNGKPAIRFDGLQDANVGDYLQGTTNLGLTNGFSAFLVYTKADRVVAEEAPVLIGVPNTFNAVRGFYIRSIAGIPNEMAFSAWGNDYGTGFRIPVSTPRIWTERLNTNQTQIEFFDTDGVNNFSIARPTSRLVSPGSGYYVGGLGSQTRNLKGDIAEIIFFQAAISDADRNSVEGYLRDKYLSSPASNLVTYQWRFNGTNISGATGSSFSIESAQVSDEANYSVLISNGSGSVLSADALLTVIPNNHPPVASPQTFSVDEDNNVSITLSANDPDGDGLIYNVTPPGNGTLSGTAPELTYTPNLNFNGTDSFTYQVYDGQTESAATTVFITVLPVNDAPVASSQTVSVNEDNSLPIELAAVDPDEDAITFNISAPANGVLSGIAPHLIYTPNTNFHGTDEFTFSVNDGTLESAVASVKIKVVSVNDAPIARAKASPSFLFSSNETSTVVIAPCDGDAIVVLDASDCHDVESDSLEYFWIEGTNVLSVGQITTNVFSPGTHWLALNVSDGADFGIANLDLEIITPAQSVAELIAFLENSDLPNNRKQPLFASLNTSVASFSRCQTTAALNQLEAFQQKVKAQVAPLNATLAQDLLDISNEIISAVNSDSSGGSSQANRREARNSP